MGCNDYNLHLEGSEGNESPTPEYKIYLDGVGVNGYSPTVDIVNENTASFQIQTNDINGSELTSPIPKLSYLQSDYVSNTSLTSTLAGYLQVNGSNANNPININGIDIHRVDDYSTLINTSMNRMRIGFDKETWIRGNYVSVNGTSLRIGGTSGSSKAIINDYDNDLLLYGTNSNKYELATINDIPTVSDATITLTQGGVTKGTFTLNGSATTIDLDAGGSTITNPLGIGYTQGGYSYSLNLGVNESTSKIISNYTIASGGSYFGIPIRLLNGATSPLTLTEDVNGLYGLSLNIDDTTIKVNQDGQLYAVGGGGTTYTAGTGIDITGGVISIDTSVVAQLSDIPDTSDMATQTWVGNQGYLTSSSLTNYVTTNTQQTITASKIFDDGGILFYDEINNTNRNGITYNETVGVYVGDTGEKLLLQGSDTHPYYNTNSLALTSEIPDSSDYVDLLTAQSISGVKTFNDSIKLNGAKYLQYTDGTQTVNLIGTNNSTVGSGYVWVGNKSDYLMLYGKGTRPQYTTGNATVIKDIAFTDDIPSLTNYVTNTDYATTSVGGVVKVDGSTITIDSNGVISATGGSGGLQNTATGTNSLTILGTATSGSASINIGSSSTATRSNSVAIGNSANTVSQYSVAIGYNAKAGTSSDSSNGAVAIGYNAGGDYSKGNTVAIGNNAVAKSTGSIAIGNSAEVGNINYTNGIAIGNGSQVYGANSINLGYGANTTANSLSVGFYGQNSNNPYALLDGTTGLIPDARLSSNIARTSNVANTSLSNLVSSAGDIITNAVMPDIAQTVYFSTDTIIQLPYDAFVNGVAYGGSGSTWVGIDLYVYSDSAGTTQIFYQGGASLFTTTTSMYLPKGSYMKFVATGPSYLLSYTPLKGVS